MKAGEETYRLYNCRRCARQVQICRDCDRGHQYCAGECARIRRQEARRRAGRRYQGSYRGACRHAARQRVWRARHAKVTHQGSFAPGDAVIVVASAITATEEPHAVMACIAAPPSATACAPVASGTQRCWPVERRAVARARCCFCGRVLSRFARLGPLRGGP